MIRSRFRVCFPHKHPRLHDSYLGTERIQPQVLSTIQSEEAYSRCGICRLTIRNQTFPRHTSEGGLRRRHNTEINIVWRFLKNVRLY